MFKTILVGIDFSPYSDSALMESIELAGRHGAKVVLCSVAPVYWPRMPSDSPLGQRFEDRARDRIAGMRAELHALRRRQPPHVPMSVVVVEGDPDTELALVARDLHADLVAVGTHGRSGLQRFLMGSVAERVVRESDRDTLVVRGAAGAHRRVLVPVDFSPVSTPSVDAAVAVAARGAEIELFHCTEHREGGSGGPSASALADRLIARHADAPVKLRFREAGGRPAHAIVESLEQDGFDLVVVGSHGHRGWRDRLVGTVTERTVRHAPCSVLVVHASRADRGGR
jgi:nucleotide-binding universal stress UspA family protein